MDTVNITINGLAVSAPVGSTILDAAKQANIDIPTLCDHPALRPSGSCRICVVEVKDQRVLQTACTFPITEGMVVQTESARVVGARKLVLDLLFSERNHFCPYCQSSGNCELQNLGYRYGLDHWVYPTYTAAFPVDASHKYLLMEHNRCVLCGRCIRVCGDLVANHTLGLQQRGAKSMIHADMGLPWGSSSCVSCGSCAQVCPTGTIADKRSAFMGRDVQMQFVQTACSHCSMGCGMKVVTRNNSVVRIEGDWDDKMSAGLLCEKGRFAPLFDRRERLLRPLVRKNGRLEATDWKEAMHIVAERLGGQTGAGLAVATTGDITNEALYLMDRIFRDALKKTEIGLLSEALKDNSFEPEGIFSDLAASNLILVAGADPVKHQPVASFFIKQKVDAGGRLIVIGSEENTLSSFACLTVGMDDIPQAVEIALRAENPVVLFGPGLTEKAAEALAVLKGKASFVALEPGVNTRAARKYGLTARFDYSAAGTLYVVLGGQGRDNEGKTGNIDAGSFVIVQSCYVSPLTQRADVVLPMAIWSERAGSLTNTEGRIVKVNRAVDPAGEAKPDWEILALLAERLGVKIGSSLDEVFAAIRQ